MEQANVELIARALKEIKYLMKGLFCLRARFAFKLRQRMLYASP
jgi:hypothetical protein